MKLLLRIYWVSLLLLGTRHVYAQTATATLDCSSTVSVFRVGCPYRYTVNLSSLPCASASGYAWDACPAEATVTAGGTSGDNFIELTFNRETTGPSKAYGVTIYLVDGPYCSRSSSTARAIRYYRADNTPLTANPYTAQTTICQYTPFTLILANASNVASCVWQQKDMWNTTWSDVSNGTGSPNNNFACSVAGLYISTTYRARLIGCSDNQYTPPSYSSEIQITTGTYASAAGVVVGERDVVTGNNQGSLVAANWSGQFKYWQYSLDNGANWITLPQNTTEELTYENLIATTLYRTVVTQCSQDAYSPSCPIRVHAATDDFSWTETKTFALNGTTLASDSRTYFDTFSKPLQSQAKSLSTGRVLATQPLYGKYDQAVGSTLAAPIAGPDFAYSPGFISPASAAYDYTRFDDGPKLNAPEAVSSATPNTLGWYYSTNNTTEPYTAVTSFPYSRTDAMADGSTGVSRAAGPGVGLQTGSTHEVVQGSFPVRAELDQYLAVRNQQFASTLPNGSNLSQGLMTWLPFDDQAGTVARDASGHGVSGQVSAGTWTPSSATSKGALTLSAAQDVRLPLSGTPTAFTVSFWVNPPQLSDYNACLVAVTPQSSYGVWGAFCFHNTSNGSIAAGINALGSNDRIITAPGVMEVNTWQHYVFTYAAGTGRLYKNGQLISSVNNMPAPGAWTSFIVGGSSVNSSTPFQASINNLRIYFRAISSQEVQDLYQKPTAADIGAGVTSLQQAAVQQLSTDADGNSALVFADKSGHPVMSARPATGADAWATARNSVEIGWPHSVQISKSSPLSTLLQFIATADIMAFDNSGRLIITGSPAQVAQQLGSSGDIQNYLFYSTDPFTVINDPGTGGAADVFASQQREAYPYFNFYIVGDGDASVTNKPTLPGSQYSIINTVTGNPVSLSSSSPLPPGCYQVRIISGSVTLAYNNRYKDISYSFYNQKGQLVESIAPKGVQQLLQSGLATPPTYVATFEYDQQGRQTAMNEPDAGRTVFAYRADGKLRFSQNAKQAAQNTFSYIGYDAIGRVVEVGECLVSLSSVYPNYVEDISYGGSGLPGYYTRRDIIHTTYDVTDAVASPNGCPSTSYHLDGYTASFLGGRVATVARYSTGSPYSGYTLSSHTWYSYDEQGRIQWQIQQTAGQPARTIDYTYNAAGNTAAVCYQKNTPAERLTHYYTYDADNRLSKVQTDTNDPASNPYGWGRTLHADYTYYLTGALRRVAYAYNLQGVDYTYTAAGQLKSINDADLSQDPGQDGNGRYTSPDFWGTSLHY